MALHNNQKFTGLGITRLLSIGVFVSMLFCGKALAEEMGLAKAYVEAVVEDAVTVYPPEKVIKECTAILARNPKPAVSTLITAYHARARAYLNVTRYGPAKEDIEELLKLQPKNVDFQFLHAGAQVALGNRKEALTEMREIIRLHPRYARARIAIALVLADQGDLDEAMTQVNDGIDLDKNNPKGLLIRALIASRRHELKQALEDVTQYINRRPFHGYAMPWYPYTFRGQCLLTLRRPRAAIADFVMARVISPKNGTAAGGVCGCYAGMGKWEMAHQAALEYLRLAPMSVRAKLLYIHTCGETGRWDAGEKLIQEMKKTDDKDTYVHSAAGNFYCDAGRYELAVEFYDRAIDLSAKGPEGAAVAFYCKAILLACCPNAKLRDGRRAVELAENALKSKGLLKWDKWQAQAALAVAHAECGDFDKAIEFAKEAMKDAGPESWSKTDLEGKIKLFQEKKPYRFKEKKGKETEPNEKGGR